MRMRQERRGGEENRRSWGERRGVEERIGGKE